MLPPHLQSQMTTSSFAPLPEKKQQVDFLKHCRAEDATGERSGLGGQVWREPRLCTDWNQGSRVIGGIECTVQWYFEDKRWSKSISKKMFCSVEGNIAIFPRQFLILQQRACLCSSWGRSQRTEFAATILFLLISAGILHPSPLFTPLQATMAPSFCSSQSQHVSDLQFKCPELTMPCLKAWGLAPT